MVGTDDILYLDNNATTKIDPVVLEEMLPFLTTHYANPSSGYQSAARVRKAIDVARQRVAASLGCEPSEVVFTSGGTESNNAAISSALLHQPAGKHIVISAVEHSAVRRHAEELSRRGCEVSTVGVGPNGDVDLAEVEEAIRPNTMIVSFMWANNETGVLFPLEKIAAICAGKGVLFHTDAVQAVGKLPIRLRNSPIAFLSLSAHKFHGPKGVGALYINQRVSFRSSILGGSHENGRRAGTENVASIIGMGKAAERAEACLREEQQRVGEMRDQFESTVLAAVERAHVNGAGAARLSNTTNISFAAIESQAALLLLDRYQLCCSAGSACKTTSAEGSHVLRAMGLEDASVRGSLRFSFGRFNTSAEVPAAAERVCAVVRKLRGLAAVSESASLSVG